MISVVIGWWWKGGGVDFRKEILMISYSKDLPFQVLFLKKKKSFSTIHPPTILFEFYLMSSTTTSFPIVPSWIILWSSIKKSLHVINISYSIFLNLVDLSYHRRSPWKKKDEKKKDLQVSKRIYIECVVVLFFSVLLFFSSLLFLVFFSAETANLITSW